MSKAVAGILVVTVAGFVATSMSFGQDEETANQSLAEDYIVGKWTAEGRLIDGRVKGNMTVRPGAGGRCLIYNWNFRVRGGEAIRGTAVGGRDPNTDEFIEYCFESDGSHFISRYDAARVGDVGVGHGKRTGTVKGKEYTGKITVDRKGRDHFIYTVVSESGEDVELVFRRAKDGKAKRKN